MGERGLCIETFRIGSRSYPDVRRRLIGESAGIPEGLDAALVWGAVAGWGLLADDLRLRASPGPQEMIQLHERER